MRVAVGVLRLEADEAEKLVDPSLTLVAFRLPMLHQRLSNDRADRHPRTE